MYSALSGSSERDRSPPSRQLPHTLAVNEFFVALIRAARTNPDRELAVWWPERRCETAWGSSVRPDGYGEWAQPGGRVEFWAEIDRGTETLDRLLRKTLAYTRLTGHPVPVLFQLPGLRREYGQHQILGTPEITIATTTADLAATGPDRPIWLTCGTGSGRRVALIDLAGVP